MKTKLEKIIVAIGVPILVGSISSGLVGNSRAAYAQLTQPEIAPPGWIFPIVWGILFVLMGIASYLIATSHRTTAHTATSQGEQVKEALTIYGVQLVVNFFWSIIFFRMERYLLAFLWIILLWVLILKTIKAFYPISKVAAYLLIPYLLWVTFAGMLNLFIYFLN